MRSYAIAATVLCGALLPVALLECDWSLGAAQAPDPQPRAANPLNGKWTYRSFRSDPNLAADPTSLLFGKGTLALDIGADNQLRGTLGGDGWQLQLTGTYKAADPAVICFQGKGKIDGEDWVYDYLGYVVPTWPNGVDHFALQQTPQEELRELENAWAAAVATNDADKIGRFFPDRFLFVGAGGILQNRDQH